MSYFQKDLKLLKRMLELVTQCVKGFSVLWYCAQLRELQFPTTQRQIRRENVNHDLQFVPRQRETFSGSFSKRQLRSHLSARSASLDCNSRNDQPHLLFEWSGRETDCHHASRKHHCLMRSRSNWDSSWPDTFSDTI